IDGAVAVLRDLHQRGVPLYALSNWPTEGFSFALKRFDFLGWFRGILVSGEVGVIKPDPRIYELLIERFGVEPQRTVYIDDVEANVVTARLFGMHAIHFTTPAALREELVGLGLMPRSSCPRLPHRSKAARRVSSTARTKCSTACR